MDRYPTGHAQRYEGLFHEIPGEKSHDSQNVCCLCLEGPHPVLDGREEVKIDENNHMAESNFFALDETIPLEFDDRNRLANMRNL